MTLQEYWDAFWADDAPYFFGAIERDDRDIFNNATTWGEPDPVFATWFGTPVI